MMRFYSHIIFTEHMVKGFIREELWFSCGFLVYFYLNVEFYRMLVPQSHLIRGTCDKISTRKFCACDFAVLLTLFMVSMSMIQHMHCVYEVAMNFSSTCFSLSLVPFHTIETRICSTDLLSYSQLEDLRTSSSSFENTFPNCCCVKA